MSGEIAIGANGQLWPAGIAGKQADQLVIEVQRMWLVAAAATVAREGFLDMITERGVCWRAGVAEETFERLFEDLEDCLVQSFAVATALAADRAGPALRSGKTWPERLTSGLLELLGFFAEEPELASVCLLEPRPGYARLRQQREKALGVLSALVEEGRHTEGTLEPRVGSGARVVRRALEAIRLRIDIERGFAPPDLAGEVLGIVFAPYLGDQAVPPSARARLSAWRAVERDARWQRTSLQIRLAGPMLNVLAQLASESARGSRPGR